MQVIINADRIQFNPALAGKTVRCTGNLNGLYRVAKIENWDTIVLHNSKGFTPVLIDDLVFGQHIEMDVIN